MVRMRICTNGQEVLYPRRVQRKQRRMSVKVKDLFFI